VPTPKDAIPAAHQDLRDVLKQALIENGIADAETTTHLHRASVSLHFPNYLNI